MNKDTAVSVARTESDSTLRLEEIAKITSG